MVAKIRKIEATPSFTAQKKIRVAAYARVSTGSDEQLLSLETQKEHYDSFIKSHPEWEYAGLYYDEGISGTKVEKRDGLVMLLKDCEEGRIDRVITKSISRFSRNTTNTLEMVRNLSKLGIYIFFEKENIDTEHMSSELMLSILSSIAESESRSISENNKWSIKHRYEEGTYIIGYPPYGYDNIDGKMVIVPEEAAVVREIFTWALSGKGSHIIANTLNERGISSKRGAKWHASTVQGILKNEKYTGDVIFQKTFTDERFNRHTNYGEKNMYLCRQHHEAIVTHEIFDKVAEAMNRRGQEKGQGEDTGKYQNRYAFSGRIICGECGSTFKRRNHYKPSGNYIAWSCNGHLKDKDSCSMLYVNDNDIKLALVRMLNKLQVGQRQVIKAFIIGLRGQNDKERLHRINELEEKLEANQEQQQVLVKLMSSGYIEPDIYHSEKNDLLQEAELLYTEKQKLSRNISGDLNHLQEAEKLMRFLSRKGILQEYSDELFLEFVDSITVQDRHTFTFNLKCGLKLTERLVVA